MEKQDLDQHFMVDTELLKFIIESTNLVNEDIVLEIGPGDGRLTKLLCSKCKVVGVERDDKVCEKLNSIDNLYLVKENILDVFFDLEFNKIVSNIPYSISEPLIKMMIKKKFELSLLTTGITFYEKLMSDGKLGVICREIFNIECLKIIKPDSFSPKPKTDSCLMKIEHKKEENESNLRRLIFLDDKLLKNSLIHILTGREITKKQAKNLIAPLKILLEKKLWELTDEEFYMLLEFINEKI